MRPCFRVLQTLAAFALITWAQGQDAFRGKIYVDGKFYASAEFGQSLSTDGKLSGHLNYSVADHSYFRTVSFVSDKTGRLIRESVTVAGKRPVLKTIEFGPSGAKVTTMEFGKNSTYRLPYPKVSSFDAPCRFWFVRDHPKPGTTCHYTVLDTTQMVWQPTASTYVGDEKITYMGQKVSAHKVKSGESISWYDDKGILYKHQGREGLLVRDGVPDTLGSTRSTRMRKLNMRAPDPTVKLDT